MNDIKNSLIKIAYQNPNLRKDLVKVLEQASNKQEAIKGIIKLAYVNPEIREYALPLIKKEGGIKDLKRKQEQAQIKKQKKEQQSNKSQIPQNVADAAENKSYTNIALKQYMTTELKNQKLKNPALKDNPNAQKDVAVSTVLNHAADPNDPYHEDSKKILEPYLEAIIKESEKEKGEKTEGEGIKTEDNKPTTAPTTETPAEGSPQAIAEQKEKEAETVIDNKANEIINLSNEEQEAKIQEMGKEILGGIIVPVFLNLGVPPEEANRVTDGVFEDRAKDEEIEKKRAEEAEELTRQNTSFHSENRAKNLEDVKNFLKEKVGMESPAVREILEKTDLGIPDDHFESTNPEDMRNAYENLKKGMNSDQVLENIKTMLNTLPRSVIDEMRGGLNKEDITEDISVAAQVVNELADTLEVAQAQNEGKKGWFSSIKDSIVKQFRVVRDSSKLGESSEERRKFLESKGLTEQDLYGDKRDETYKEIEKFNELNKLKEKLGDDFKDKSMEDIEALNKLKKEKFDGDDDFEDLVKKLSKDRDYTGKLNVLEDNLKLEKKLKERADYAGVDSKIIESPENRDRFINNHDLYKKVTDPKIIEKAIKGEISTEDVKNYVKGKEEYGIDYLKLDDAQKENFKNMESILKDDKGKDKYDLKEGLFGGGEKKKIIDKIISGEYKEKDVKNYMKSKDLNLDYDLIKDKEDEEKKLNETSEVLKDLKGLTKKEKQRVIQEQMMGTFSKDHVETFNKIRENNLSDEEREVIKKIKDPFEQTKQLKQFNDHKDMVKEYAKDKSYVDETTVDNSPISYSEIQDLAKNGDDEDKAWAKKKLKSIEKDYEKHLQESLVQKQKEKKGIEDLFKPKTEGAPEKRITGPDGKKYRIDQIYEMADNPKDPISRDWASNQLKSLKEKVEVRSKVKDVFKPSKPGEAPQKLKSPDGKRHTIDEVLEMAEDPGHEKHDWAKKEVKELEDSVSGKLEADEKEIAEEARVEKEKKVQELTSKKDEMQKNFAQNKQKVEESHNKKIDSIDQEHGVKKKKIEDGVNENIAKKTKETQDRIEARKTEDDKKIETIVNDKLKDKKDLVDTHTADLESAKALGADPDTIKDLEEKKAKAVETFEKEKQTLMSKDDDIKQIKSDQLKFNKGQNSALGTYKSKKEKEKNKALKDLDNETSLSKSEIERKTKEEMSQIEGEHKKQVKDIDKELTGDESKEEPAETPKPEINTEDIQKALPNTPPATVKKIENDLGDMFEGLDTNATEKEIENKTKKVLKRYDTDADAKMMDDIIFAMKLRRKLMEENEPETGKKEKDGNKKEKGESKEEANTEEMSMTEFFKGRTFTYEYVKDNGQVLTVKHDFNGLLNRYKKTKSNNSGMSQENKDTIQEVYEDAKQEYEMENGIKTGSDKKENKGKKQDERKEKIKAKIKQMSKFDEKDFDELKPYFDDNLKFDKERYLADKEKKRGDKLKPINDLKMKLELKKTKSELENLKKKMDSMSEPKKASIRKQLVKIALRSKQEIKDMILPMI
jgi:hypothetical protein